MTEEQCVIIRDLGIIGLELSLTSMTDPMVEIEALVPSCSQSFNASFY